VEGVATIVRTRKPFPAFFPAATTRNAGAGVQLTGSLFHLFDRFVA
jgi:hypothetical protein